MKKLLLSLSFATCAFLSQAQISFKGIAPAAIIGSYNFTYTSDKEAQEPWGGDISASIIQDTLKLIASGIGSDSLGCIAPTAPVMQTMAGKIVLLYRGSCTFYNKVLYAQQRGAIAVIVINNVDGQPIGMGGSTVSGANAMVTIPAVQISKTDGALLRAQMNLGNPVVVAFGNFAGFYADNIGLDINYTKLPKSYSIPKLTAGTSSEVLIPLGTSIFNRGSNPTTTAKVSVTIRKGATVLFTDTSDTQSIIAADTTENQISFPDFPLSDVTVGKYSITYVTHLFPTIDLDRFNDTLKLNFEITEDIFSLVPLNSNGVPIATVHTRVSPQNVTLTSFTQCIKYENENAGRIGAEGIYFSASGDVNLSLDQEEFTIESYRWDDIFDVNSADYQLNFESLALLNKTIYNMVGNNKEVMTYVPFSASVPLENATKYLFCITPTTNSDITLGYNNTVYYGLNDFTYNENINPGKMVTSSERWFSGFRDITAAFGIKTADKVTLGIVSNKLIEGSVYPNPSNDAVTISLNTKENVKLTVTDISGKIVINNTLNMENGSSKVNVEFLQSGMYIFNIVLENGTTSQFNVVKN